MDREDKDRPRSLNKDLLIIAGEHSGDQHIANVLGEFFQNNPSANVYAFAGKESKASGATLIFDMTKHSVLGIIEVIKKIFFFRKLINNIVEWIENHNPKAICMVDSPALNLRIAKILFQKKLLNKAGGNIKLYYYISPQIWAWKANRRFEIAKYMDSLATIFPFEKEYYKDTNLNVVYTGHPFMQYKTMSQVIYKKDAPIMLLPGSRKSSITKIFPNILASFKYVLKHKPNMTGIIVYPDESILGLLRKILNKKFPCLLKNVEFVSHDSNVEASAAIMSSGTMSLRCCLAGIPGAIVYKVNLVTYLIGKIFVKIKHLGIANILLKQSAWPEFIQQNFKPEIVGNYILHCLDNNEIAEAAAQNSKLIKNILNNGTEMSAGSWLALSIK